MPSWFKKKSRPERGIYFSADSGDSVEEAVIINGARNMKELIKTETFYLKARFGELFQRFYYLGEPELKDWISFSDDGHRFDKIILALPGGAEKTIFFDITDYCVRRSLPPKQAAQTVPIWDSLANTVAWFLIAYIFISFIFVVSFTL